jgi:hypothetical protein
VNLKSILKIITIFAFLFGSFTLLAKDNRAYARGGCFIGETKILTSSGYKEIQEIKAGDEILSLNISTNKREVSKVAQIDVLNVDRYFVINNKIKVTETHPFYVWREKEWHLVEVKDIDIGDELFGEDGDKVRVDSKEEKFEDTAVYNLINVEPNNNYFAGGVLVHNKGGCFAGTTLISTTNGEKQVKDLKTGEDIYSFDPQNGKKQVSKIERIDIFEVDEYYLINNKTKVTGGHPFYIRNNGNIELKEVANLRIGDKLISENNSEIQVNSIDIKREKTLVYNLVNVIPNNNYFADGVLVHNKGGGGGGGGGGFSSSRYSSGSSSTNYSCAYITNPTERANCERNKKWMIGASVLAPLVFTLGFTALGSVANRYTKKALNTKKSGVFTHDKKLISYTREIVPHFTNTYSPNHTYDTAVWELVPEPSETKNADYMHLISKTDLFEKIKELFVKYQTDWSKKSFDSMSSYVKEPFLTTQKNISLHDFGDNFDIVYKPEIFSITLIDTKVNGEEVNLTVQINAQMINFEVDETGGVFSGEPTPRSFSEDWSFSYDAVSKNLYLTNIEQI